MKSKNKDITFGELQEAMLVYATVTDADTLRRLTEYVIAKMEALKEAENLLIERG